MKKSVQPLFHFNRVHHKLGLMIFLLLMTLVLALGLVLYPLFINFYFKQVVNELIHRSHSHASVLSENFTQSTLMHVALMEKNAITSVVVVDDKGNRLVSSRTLPESLNSYLQPLAKNDANPPFQLVEGDWRDKPFIVSKSPVVIQGKTVGTVIMFAPTDPIRSAVTNLQRILIGVGIIALVASGVLIFVVSKSITRPLIRMKTAIEQLSQNQYNLTLPVKGNDEVAELSSSIYDLAQELKHYRTERQEFLAEISHELRTPITYIRGYADVLKKGVFRNESDRETYVQLIYDATNRLYHLIDDLFELVQLDQLDYRVDKVRIDMIQLVDQVIFEMQDRYAESEISLTWEKPHGSVVVLIDPKRIAQVLINLLENARKYTPAGGNVIVQLQVHQKEIELRIKDTGRGIPKDKLSYIWQRFFRVEKSRSREHGGAGLGLSICKRIVDLHNGSIRVISEVGKGSTFIVSLPK